MSLSDSRLTSTLNQDQEHRPNSLLPMFTDRQRQMLESLKFGCINDLAAVIYSFAQEDYEASRSGLRAMSERLINDRDGDQEVVDLLHTIHRHVLETIILGIVGWSHHNNVDGFKDLFYDLDNCAGVYLVTFVDEVENLCLSINQWGKIKEMAERYSGLNDCQVTTQSSQDDRAAALEAAAIDHAIIRKYDDLTTVEKDCLHGQRSLYFNDMGIWIKQLEERMDSNLDFEGDIKQAQAPAMVGCSQSILTSVSYHDSLDDMQSSAKPLVFLLSCLKVMGIKARTIQLPILKIWKRTQLEVAECLVTYLAGSMIFNGGCDSVEPGGQGMNQDAPEKFERALTQIFYHNSGAKDNLDESQQRTAQLSQALKTYQLLRDNPNAVADKINEVTEAVQSVTDEFNGLMKNINRATVAYEQAIESAEKIDTQLSETLADLQSYVKLQDDLEKWLNGQGVDPESPRL